MLPRAENATRMSSTDQGFNDFTPTGYYLAGLCYFICFVLFGSYFAFRMPFL